jgi:UDP-glucose 4-epimerase
MPIQAHKSEPGQGAVLVTGSSGFIGSWLTKLLADSTSIHGLDIVSPRDAVAPHISADIRDPRQLQSAADRAGSLRAVVHLAAKAEAVTPFAWIPDLIATNVLGTLHVAKAFAPPLFVFSSSCAVYGNTPRTGVSPAKHAPNPVGLYGDSKATGEMVLADWAHQTGSRAVAFRFGNVIGARCRGLIPFLVRHALRYPQGDVPAQMRGNGRIIRDYVPVDHLVQVITRALELRWTPGSFQVFNIGSGQGLTNGEVARRVQRILKRRGYRLSLNLQNPIANGEAHTAVLRLQETERTFSIKRPSASAVDRAIEEAVHYWLEHGGQSASATAG